MPDTFDLFGGGAVGKLPTYLRQFGLLATTANVPNLGVYTPDLSLATEHNLNIQGANITVANPLDVGGPPGFSHFLYIHFRNVSGGVIAAITLGNKYKFNAPFIPPNNGFGLVTLWHHDEVQDLWYNSAMQLCAN